jgi:hypothetical protein
MLWPILLFVSIVVVWLIGAVIVVFGIGGELLERGQLGDSFGVLNSLFSALSFGGIVIALVMQRRELVAQWIEIRRAGDAHEASARALSSQLTVSQRDIRIQGLVAKAQLLLAVNDIEKMQRDGQAPQSSTITLQQIKQSLCDLELATGVSEAEAGDVTH